ncbi:hypothetical protein UF75_2349 [Desulfosporosinus sp. I2]|nr:hypothetical protein UF75_2349 [Desulfosporosinus sp. I2]
MSGRPNFPTIVKEKAGAHHKHASSLLSVLLSKINTYRLREFADGSEL